MHRHTEATPTPEGQTPNTRNGQAVCFGLDSTMYYRAKVFESKGLLARIEASHGRVNRVATSDGLSQPVGHQEGVDMQHLRACGNVMGTDDVTGAEL
jgi:hypothetical protein